MKGIVQVKGLAATCKEFHYTSFSDAIHFKLSVHKIVTDCTPLKEPTSRWVYDVQVGK
jgi:hypothetical protein